MSYCRLCKLVPACLGIISIIGCSSSVKYGLVDGVYKVKSKEGIVEKADVYLDKDDSIRIISGDKIIKPVIGESTFLKKQTFDVDFLIVPFKFRSTASGLPHQLTTQFNGNIFLGYRLDRFQVKYTQSAFAVKRSVKHRAISIGAFAGIGSESITPWTTNYNIQDEYNGFIISKGLVFLVGINDNTVGLGLGWDNLTDRDKSVWIYQNKIWYGLTYSLNLN